MQSETGNGSPLTPRPHSLLCFLLFASTRDCLYADVYSPVGASKDNPLPVFVWSAAHSLSHARRYSSPALFLCAHSVLLCFCVPAFPQDLRWRLRHR